MRYDAKLLPNPGFYTFNCFNAFNGNNNGNFPLELKDILKKGKDCHVFPKSALFILSLKI